MSVVIWFKRRDDPRGADDDRLLLFREADALDALADELGVPKLSGFFDGTEAFAGVAEDDLDDAWIAENQAWHDPLALLATVEALHARVLDPGVVPPRLARVRAELVEELAGCIAKARAAEGAGVRVHLSIVP